MRWLTAQWSNRLFLFWYAMRVWVQNHYLHVCTIKFSRDVRATALTRGHTEIRPKQKLPGDLISQILKWPSAYWIDDRSRDMHSFVQFFSRTPNIHFKTELTLCDIAVLGCLAVVSELWCINKHHLKICIITLPQFRINLVSYCTTMLLAFTVTPSFYPPDAMSDSWPQSWQFTGTVCFSEWKVSSNLRMNILIPHQVEK